LPLTIQWWLEMSGSAQPLGLAAPPDGMGQFDAVAVDGAEQARLGQEQPVRLQAAEQAGALGTGGRDRGPAHQPLAR